MNQLCNRIPVGIVILFGLSACSGGRESFRSVGDGEGDGQKKRPLSYYEATLRPSDFDEEIDIVQKTHAENHGTAPIEIPADSAVVEEVVAQGFRIQIFATSSIDEANSAKLTAEGRVGQDEVYVVYDPPVYKVRVGDYVERLEANQRLSKLINQGYPDAWVVADRVIQRKITRIPKE